MESLKMMNLHEVTEAGGQELLEPPWWRERKEGKRKKKNQTY